MKRIKFMSTILAVLMLLTLMPMVAGASSTEAQADLDAIAIPAVILGGYELPTAGTANGSAISWSADKLGVIDNNTIQAGAADKAVTLTATASNDGENATKTFNVTVKRSTVAFYDGFDAPAGTQAVNYNGWTRWAPGNSTAMSIEKENTASDNTVLKIAKSAVESAGTQYVYRDMNKTLTQKQNFILSMKLRAEQDTAVIDLRAVAQWEQDDGVLREDTATYQQMFNLRFYYRSNVIEYTQCVNPITGQEQRNTMIASGCLKVGEWQTIEIQASYEAQAFWLVIDGQSVTTQPIPYERRNIYGLGGGLYGTELGQYGYARYVGDCGLHEFWLTHVNTQHGAGQACDLLVDDVELVVGEELDSMDRTIDVEYARNDYNNIVFNPKIADKLWRVIAGKQYAGKKVILGVFSANDRLIDCPIAVVDEDGYAVFNYSLDNGKYIKAFIWDSMETLKPISQSFTETVR